MYKQVKEFMGGKCVIHDRLEPCDTAVSQYGLKLNVARRIRQLLLDSASKYNITCLNCLGHRLDYLHSGVNSSFTCFFVGFDYHINNVNYYNTLKMKVYMMNIKYFTLFVSLLYLLWVPKLEVPKHGILLSILASINP